MFSAGMDKKTVSESVVALLDKHDFDIDEMVETCLDTKKGKEHTDEVTLDFIDEIFNTVYMKRKGDFDSRYKFERQCYPSLWELKEKIEEHYLDDFLSAYDEDDLINFLEDTREFDDYIDNIKDEVRREYESDIEEEIECISYDAILEDKSPDELWIYLCNQAKCGYYDKKSLMSWLSNRLISNMNKSIYAQMSDTKLFVDDEKKINCKAA